MISVFYFPPDFHRGTDLEMRPKVENITGYDVQFHYQWIIDGEEKLWEEGAILAGDRFRKGDRLAVEVTPYTIDGEGMPFRSKEIVSPTPHLASSLPPPRYLWTALIFTGSRRWTLTAMI